jgi:hypothetical protein
MKICFPAKDKDYTEGTDQCMLIYQKNTVLHVQPIIFKISFPHQVLNLSIAAFRKINCIGRMNYQHQQSCSSVRATFCGNKTINLNM